MSRITAAVPAPNASVWVPPGRVLGIAALAGLYYGSARFGFTFQFSGPVAAIVWLPAGVGIAFLTLGGTALWPGVLIGDLLANDYSVLPVGTALGQTVGNTLEVVVAAMLIRRGLRRESPLGSVTDVVRIIVAIAVGTAVSATIGLLSLRLGQANGVGNSATIWRTWWLGDFVGALVVVPFALAWWRPIPRFAWRERGLEAAALAVGIAVLGEIALRSNRPLTYMLFPLLVWAALRFGQRGSTLAVVAVAGLTVWNTTHYEGPFVFESITSSVLATQLFIAVATISTLCLAAVVSEREQLTEEVVASRVRLVETSDRERRRLERNLHDGAQQRLIALTARLHHAGAHQTSEPISQLLVDAEEQLKLATQELRELANGLHPAVLTELGLAYAIRSIAEGATIPMTIHGLPLDRLDETTEATAYYVVAEAVANAQKHARANHIWIRMLQFETIPVLHVAVTDDGVGGATEAASGGLRGLRERVQATGGSFKLNSRPHHGTSIIAEIRQPSPTS